MPGVLIDGNDAAMVHAAVTEAVERARAGGGPTLIEALTYRIEAHTNADDATRYRSDAEVADWLARDPIDRLQKYLQARGSSTRPAIAEIAERGRGPGRRLRAAMNADPVHRPGRAVRARLRRADRGAAPAGRRRWPTSWPRGDAS